VADGRLQLLGAVPAGSYLAIVQLTSEASGEWVIEALWWWNQVAPPATLRPRPQVLSTTSYSIWLGRRAVSSRRRGALRSGGLVVTLRVSDTYDSLPRVSSVSA